MSYFRKVPGVDTMLRLFEKNERWLVLINADPDAMASAQALKRIMKGRVAECAIAKVNAVTRPDNLAMIRYARLHIEDYNSELGAKYQRFALVDSQPDHHPLFHGISFSIIIDHHPITASGKISGYASIHPEYGATSTILTELLYNLGIRPGQLLATAMQFGIKTDTGNFQRHFGEVDLRAYHYLSRFGNSSLLARISRSELHKSWLEYFVRGSINMHKAGSGEFVYVGRVPTPDILVAIADFFMRVYEMRWVAVTGSYEGNGVVIFRGDGVTKDLGVFAARQFSDVGSAGGHRSMARAEFPMSALSEDLETFAYKRMRNPQKPAAG